MIIGVGESGFQEHRRVMNKGDAAPDEIKKSRPNRLEPRVGDHAATRFREPVGESLAAEDIHLEAITESERILLEELGLSQSLGIMQPHGFYGGSSVQRLFCYDKGQHTATHVISLSLYGVYLPWTGSPR